MMTDWFLIISIGEGGSIRHVELFDSLSEAQTASKKHHAQIFGFDYRGVGKPVRLSHQFREPCPGCGIPVELEDYSPVADCDKYDATLCDTCYDRKSRGFNWMTKEKDDEKPTA